MENVVSDSVSNGWDIDGGAELEDAKTTRAAETTCEGQTRSRLLRGELGRLPFGHRIRNIQRHGRRQPKG